MKLFLFLNLLILLTSCLGGQKKSARTSVRISSKFAASVPAGGMMLYLNNKDKLTQRVILLTDTVTTVELYQGDWEFAVISWSGASPFSGTLSCGKTQQILSQENETIGISISASGCDDDYFSPPSFRAAGSTKPFRFVNCANINSASSGANCDTGLRGLINGYKIKLLTYGETPLSSLEEVQSTSLSSLSSGTCNNPVSAPNSIEPLGITVPYGGVGLKPSFVIETFSDPSCTVPLKNFFYPTGFAGTEVTSNNSVIFTTAANGDLYLETGSVMITGSTNFGSGLNTVSTSQTFTVSNFTGSNITSLSASISGSAFMFAGGSYPGTGGTCGTALTNGANCTLVVNFTRAAVGTFSETLTIFYDDGASKSLNNTLTGISANPANLTLSATTHNFGDSLAGYYKSQTINIINSGGTTATAITISEASGDIANINIPAGSNNCGTTLASGASCSFRVDFTPEVDRAYSAIVDVSYNDGLSAVIGPITFTGKGNLFPATNGLQISAFERHNDKIFVGGNFTHVGRPSGGGLPIRPNTPCSGESCLAHYTSLSALPKIAGNVYTVISDSAGGYYVGGQFTRVGTYVRNNLVRIMSNGSVDPAFVANTNGMVRGLKLDGGNLFVGGYFTAVNGTTRQYLAQVDSISGTLQAFNANVDAGVNAIDADATKLYIGGSFNNVGGSARNKIAVVDKTTASLDPQNPGSLIGSVSDLRTLLYDSNILYIGGGMTTSNLKAYDTLSNTLFTGFNSTVTPGLVTSIKPFDATRILISGSFSTINGSTRTRVALINKSTGAPDAFNVNIGTGFVYDTYHDSVNNLIHLGGSFTAVNGQDRLHYAVVTTGGTVQNIIPRFSNPVFAVTEGVPGIFAGGEFRAIEAIQMTRFAVVSATTGLVEPTDRFVTGTINAMTKDSTTLYVGGEFMNFNGTTCRGLVGLSLTTLAVNWTACTDGPVRDIHIANNHIYVGGSFANISGSARSRLAAFTHPARVLAPLAKSYNGEITSIEFLAGNLFVGGFFTVPSRLDAFDSAHNNITVPPVNAIVRNLSTDGTLLFIGGDFTNVDGSGRSRVAAINPTTRLLDSMFNSLSISGAGVYTIETFDSKIYAGGNFSAPKSNMITFDNLGAIEAPDPEANSDVQIVKNLGDMLLIGGKFTELYGVPGGNIRIKSLPPP